MEKLNKWRPALIPLLVVALFLIGKTTGVIAYATPTKIQSLLLDAGILGMLAFIAAFSVGGLVFIPGFVFVAAGVYTYGQLLGGTVGLLGAIASVSLGFVVARLVGGQNLPEIKQPLMKRLLSQLETKPLRSMFILRSVFWMAPPLNSALALSKIRFRDYFLGSVAGLVAPVVLAAVGIDFLLRCMS